MIASYYAMRSGISIDDLYCGIFCNSIGNYYGRSGWSVGAALSFRLSTHYALRGGDSGNSIYCGAFYLHAYRAASYAYLGVGAALSFKFYFYL